LTASAERQPSTLLFGLRLAGLILLLLACVPPHLLSKWVLRRSNWPKRFLRWGALAVGARPRVEGAPLGAHSFIIANHISWLDIMVLGGWTGTAFIAKAEVETTPLIGWIADQNHSLYIDRAARRDSHGQVRRIQQALSRQQPLTVFPEGTTGSGRELLPFRSTLMEAVAPPPPNVAVRPVAVDYGDHAGLVGWHSGEGGVANFKRVLGHRGTMAVAIRLLDPLPPTDDRKKLAHQARHAIAGALSSLAAPEAV
jgi:1-acyl-sn-glycerol-3-phosphate acyltransferase